MMESNTVWGYSIFEGEPGFRTIGKRLVTWYEEKVLFYGVKPKFFSDQAEAFKYLKHLVTPPKGVK
jgi:hypothetical protein